MPNFNRNDDDDDDTDDGMGDDSAEEQIQQLMQERYAIQGFDLVFDVPVDVYNSIVGKYYESTDFTNLTKWETFMGIRTSIPMDLSTAKDDVEKKEMITRRKEEDSDLATNYSMAKQSAARALFRIYEKAKAAHLKKKKR